MKTIEDLPALFLYYIQNLYAAEKQIMEAMPAIIEKAKHQSLTNALQHHLTISKKHISRLNKIFALLNEKKMGITGENEWETSVKAGVISKGTMGLIEEATELMEHDVDADVCDAAIIGCVQKIEHYEICTYGTALAYATQLHLHEAEVLLRETLDEEYDVDDLLTALATTVLNKEALPEGMEDANPNLTDEENDNASGSITRKGSKVSISERTVQSPGGRAGTSHRRYPGGESRGH